MSSRFLREQLEPNVVLKLNLAGTSAGAKLLLLICIGLHFRSWLSLIVPRIVSYPCDLSLMEIAPSAPAKQIRQKLRLGQESFAAAYGIPLDTLRAWERHELEPSPTEIAYLHLIEREPELARLASAAA